MVVLEPSLRHWYRYGENLPEGTQARLDFLTKVARRAHAFQVGHPFSIAIRHLGAIQLGDSVRYNEGYLAWVPRGRPDQAMIHDIRRGQTTKVIVPNRELIASMAICPSMVAFCTSWGRVYVWKMDGLHLDPVRIIRLTSMKEPVSMVAAGQTLLIQSPVYNESKTGPDIRRTTVYDINANFVRTWDREEIIVCCLGNQWWVSKDGTSLYSLESMSEMRTNSLLLVQTDLQDQIISTLPFDCPCAPWTTDWKTPAVNVLRPGDVLRLSRSGGSDRPRKAQSIIFGDDGCSLTARTTLLKDAADFITRSEGFSSHGCCVVYDPDFPEPPVQILDLRIGKFRTAAVNYKLHHYMAQIHPMTGRCSWRLHNLLGDETFVVMIVGEYMLVMCLDEDVSVEGEISQYRKESCWSRR